MWYSVRISAKSSRNYAEKKPNPETSSVNAKKLKYALQRTAQSLLWDEAASKQHRTCTCHRDSASDGVVVYRNTDGSSARLGNVISCGSVWCCTICAGRITESRRADMQRVQNAWLLDGGSCLLMTYTFPHEFDMPLAELLPKFSEAVDYFKSHRTYERIFGTSLALIEQREQKGKPLKNIKKGEFPRLGTVRSLEVTHGQNGWHPHSHEVLFMHDDALLKSPQVIDELKALWVECLLKAGLGDHSQINYMLERALDIRGGDYVSDYINKFGREPINVNGWTIAHEVTKANSKLGKQGRKVGADYHYTPFQLLGFATDGDEEAGQLFKEFAHAFNGKRQNYWTNGLKDWFGIDDKTEDDIAAEEGSETKAPEEEFVIRLDTEQWRDVIATNARGELIEAAAHDGQEGVIRLLDELKTRPKRHRGWFRDHARPDISRFYR